MIATARRLNALQWRQLTMAAWLLPVIDVSLRARGYGATREWLDAWATRSRHGSGPPATDGMPPECHWLAQSVGIAARRSLWPTSCLRQALALRFLLARRGIETRLHIGVKSGGDGFGAHAWVEYQGEILIGGEHATQIYTRLV